MPASGLLLAGNIAGIAGLTWATFTAVSYFEVKKKIDEQIAQGSEPYELKIEQKQRQQPAGKKQGKKKKQRKARK
eukprot:jgi/Astpho2/9895/Aster-x1617